MEDKILDISHNHYKYLLSLENVIGVGMGYKYINGKKTKELCTHILVEKKVDKKLISKNNLIPKTYMGIKTDVIKSGKVKLLNETKNNGFDATSKIRPLEGGYTIKTDSRLLNGSSVGTIGCIVTKTFRSQKLFFILSANHVLTGHQRLPIGTAIFQPTQDKNYENYIGNLSNYIMIKYNYGDGDVDMFENYVDCGIATIRKDIAISNRIAIIGRIKGVSKPKLGLDVMKVGRTSGYTQGKIITVGETINLPVDKEKNMLFKDLMTGSLKSDPGDSGSVILDKNNNVVGLTIGSYYDNGDSIFCDINTVLRKLKVDIYTG